MRPFERGYTVVNKNRELAELHEFASLVAYGPLKPWRLLPVICIKQDRCHEQERFPPAM